MKRLTSWCGSASSSGGCAGRAGGGGSGSAGGGGAGGGGAAREAGRSAGLGCASGVCGVPGAGDADAPNAPLWFTNGLFATGPASRTWGNGPHGLISVTFLFLSEMSYAVYLD